MRSDEPEADSTAPSAPPPPLVALAAWLARGAGYFLLGQKARGLAIGLTVLIVFALGLLIGGMSVIDPPNGLSLSLILQKPWYIGQVLTGVPGIVMGFVARHAGLPVSHARVNEIGTLYTAVAGMLNLMAIIDSSYRAAMAGEAEEEKESGGRS